MADTEFSALPPTSSIAATDQILLVRGGVAYRFTGPLPAISDTGNVTSPGNIYANTNGDASIGFRASSAYSNVGIFTNTGVAQGSRIEYSWASGGQGPLQIINGAGEVARFQPSGDFIERTNIFAGQKVTAGGVTAGGRISMVAGTGTNSGYLEFYRQDGTREGFIGFASAGGQILLSSDTGAGWAITGPAGLGSSAACALGITRNATTNRSINASGTINASGADYAEYMVKRAGCPTIAAGDVCGVTRAGELTRSWADAHSCVVKSTAPSIVGGDTWAAHLPARPEAPPALAEEPQPPEPLAPPPPLPPAPDSDDPAVLAAHAEAIAARAEAVAAAEAAHAEAVAAYPAAHAEWVAARDAHAIATADYEAALAAWDAQLEAARQRVDRIAFCGQVPVNVSAEVLAACEAALSAGQPAYLVAVQDLDGIGVMLVRASEMTLDSYMRRLGKLWAIRDERPVIDVQHG